MTFPLWMSSSLTNKSQSNKQITRVPLNFQPKYLKTRLKPNTK